LNWCEENWWRNGYVPRGILVSSVVKFLFYKEWFSVMQLVGIDGDHLGYYVDVDTPIQKDHGEYFLTDLLLDLWIFPNGRYIELDRSEFENSLKSRLIT
jgi:predicted RNA-binding protein associated with RNAse of E/G family